ncbi:MAG: COX15/CtaA family protein [Verrucomicrobiota bacterium]|nr:COX15/CtaA family protein [Verrucomicrobiota bacterium]
MLSRSQQWLQRFAWFSAAATLCLIGIGGVVTSKGVGMAVPDWPTTYGYNMFLFPVSQWVGGIFYEHTHRLVASFVGLLTTILAAWLFFADNRKWMRLLGVIAFFLVVFQGVLGGLRVTAMKDEIGIFHGTLAQLFFCLICAITFFSSNWWRNVSFRSDEEAIKSAMPWFIVTTSIILLQLIIGASMRHQHSGLAVPDFPLAYGKWWPDLDPASLERYNQMRLDVRDYGNVTAPQIILHMTHRFIAVIILALTAFCFWKSRGLELPLMVRRLVTSWALLILTQATLGIATVLSKKAADIATAHVVIGALSLAWGVLIVIALKRVIWRDVPVELQRQDQLLNERGGQAFAA